MGEKELMKLRFEQSPQFGTEVAAARKRQLEETGTSELTSEEFYRRGKIEWRKFRASETTNYGSANNPPITRIQIILVLLVAVFAYCFLKLRLLFAG